MVSESNPSAVPTPARLPRWRGFNLLGMFWAGPKAEGRFREEDFDIIADWGFDFVRLPMSYRFWAQPEALFDIDEKALQQVDKAIEFGRQRGIHVNINFHRIPGFCVGEPMEPASLWTDQRMLDAACFHWQTFAKRYKGIPNTQVSFDLINEPAHVEDGDYVRVHRAIIQAIRSEDTDRLIICDGTGYGHTPVPGMIGQGVAMSTRGYHPFPISHYRAKWVKGSDNWPAPAWPFIEPGKDGKQIVWDKAYLREHRITPWKKMESQGVGVHIGEWGCHNLTPHAVVLPWMQANLELFKEAGWGWALWNIRGAFGVLDSNRADVQYEDFRGHKLDRKMLELLRAG
jgi:endoglucanase